MGKVRLGSTGWPRSWFAGVSGPGGSRAGTRKASTVAHDCESMPVSAASLGPRPWPTHDGRSSISTASPSGHPSPASGHGRNGLFVLPAPCRSLGWGLEEMTIFLPGRAGGWTGEVCRAPRAGARLGWGRTPAGQGPSPMREALPCSVPCPSLLSGIGVSRLGIFPQELSAARSLTSAPATGWGGLRCQRPPGGRSPCQKSKMLDAGCPLRLWAFPWGCVPATNQRVRRRVLSGGLKALGSYWEPASLKTRTRGERTGPH